MVGFVGESLSCGGSGTDDVRSQGERVSDRRSDHAGCIGRAGRDTVGNAVANAPVPLRAGLLYDLSGIGPQRAAENANIERTRRRAAIQVCRRQIEIVVRNILERPVRRLDRRAGSWAAIRRRWMEP
jgi:hypothetical protein